MLFFNVVVLHWQLGPYFLLQMQDSVDVILFIAYKGCI